jgi:cysteine-rich repeat protein
LILLAILSSAQLLQAADQVITADPAAQSAAASAAVSLDAIYDTTPADPTLTGMGMRIHFDSSELTFDSFSDVLSSGLIVNPDLVTPESDSGDFDSDPATDQFVRIAWLDISGNWPGVLPQTLLTVHFQTAAGFSGTQINFSATDQPPGWGFQSTPGVVTLAPGGECGDGVLDPGEACDDGNTVGGDCCAADCTYETAGSTCDDDLYCNVDETCDGAGSCAGGSARDCSDAVDCTDDSCDEAGDQCVNTANDANCPDDGLFCTGDEFCDAVADCASTGDPCAPGTVCNETTDLCDPGLPLLTVTKAGSGTGTVTSDPAGIDCGSDCNETFGLGTEVTLTAARDSGSTFDGWNADCSGTLASASVLMNTSKTCTATFELCVGVKDVSGMTVSDQQLFEACTTLSAGNFQILGPGGNVTFVAGGQIVLGEGFFVGTGAEFTASLDSSLLP